MSKPISLSVHKNKVEAKRKRDLAKTLRDEVEKLTREVDLRAYAVVGIAANGKGYALWNTGAIMPMWAFPDTVSYLLREDMQSQPVAEDWRPTLTLKGGL